MLSSSRRFRLPLYLFLVLPACQAAGATSNTGELELQVEPAQVTVSSGVPIVLELTLHNRSDLAKSVDLGGNRLSNLLITIRSPHRAAVPGRLEDEPGDVAFGGPVELAPGEKFQRKIVLDRWFHFGEPGSYKATVSVPAGRPDPPRVLVAQDEVEILVHPRDSGALTVVCSELASQAIGTPGASARLAASALSQVWDEVCVSALARVLEESTFGKEEAVIGLARVGTAEAIRVLVERWEKLETSVKARALWEFERRGNGKALRSALGEVGPEADQ